MGNQKFDFLDWLKELDRICKALYCIDTHDMGYDADQLRHYWAQKDTPQDLADHFGTKFNLTLAQEVMIRV